MKRWVNIFWTGLGLIFISAAPLLWATSYWRGFSILDIGIDDVTLVESDKGYLKVHLWKTPPYSSEPTFRIIGYGEIFGYFDLDRYDSQSTPTSILGFQWAHITDMSHPIRYAYIPYWFLCIPTFTWMLIKLYSLIGWKKRHRLKQGLCLNCGYDLRASPERCPECGTEIHPRENEVKDE